MLSPLYGQISPLRVPTKAVRVPVSDSDAESYLQVVEAADGAALEQSVADAINDFVVGCKSDGIWSAIKAACILAGARTLDGALVPLVGTAPTNNNFVSGDYDRETGLVGNGSTKYLDSNRNNNADPQNDNHNAIYIHTAQTAGAGGVYMGAGGGSSLGANLISRSSTAANMVIRQRSSLAQVISGMGGSTGLFCVSRSSSTGYSIRSNGATSSQSSTSQTPFNGNMHIFQRSLSPFPTDARLSFYSIGESIDLADLDTRVSTLMTDIAAAIP